jgi:hypothetical protein
MTKKTILELNGYARNTPGYGDRIVEDYKKASDEWRNILANPKSKTVDDLTTMINENIDVFFEMNHSGTWEDAMIWTAFLYYYDAQTGLKFENGFHADRILEAIKQSECSTYAKRTAAYAYFVLRDKDIK